jgi:hypothetical protein
MSDVNVVEEMRAKLMRPFPRSVVEQRPGAGGRKLDYVEWHTKWMRVLAVAPSASWEVVTIIPRDEGWVVHGRLTIEGVSRDGVGFDKPKTQKDRKTGEMVAQESDNGVKAAATDALARACTLFGIGLELYGADTSWFQKAAAPPAEVQPAEEEEPAPAEPPAQQESSPQPAESNGESDRARRGVFASWGKVKDVYEAQGVDSAMFWGYVKEVAQIESRTDMQTADWEALLGVLRARENDNATIPAHVKMIKEKMGV